MILLEILSFNVNAIGQNLVQNGSLTGTPGPNTTAPQWTYLAGSPDINEVGPVIFVDYSWFMGYPVASSDGGTWQNMIASESIQQTITGLSVGETYYFSFEYCLQAIINDLGTIQYSAVATPNILIDGATGYSNPTIASNFYEWKRHSAALVATSTSITIKVRGNGFSYLAYDGFYLSTTPLVPVKLIDLNGISNNSVIKLTWSTISEVNSSHFIIQKSNNGNNWEDIGIVNANNNTSQLTNYTYADTSVAMLNYYRLKIVDIDGKYVLSKVCFIKIPSRETDAFSIYPNPIHSSARLFINDPITKEQQFVLYDMLGRKLKYFAIPSGFTFIDLDFSSFKKGNYLLKLVGSKTSKCVIIN